MKWLKIFLKLIQEIFSALQNISDLSKHKFNWRMYYQKILTLFFTILKSHYSFHCRYRTETRGYLAIIGKFQKTLISLGWNHSTFSSVVGKIQWDGALCKIWDENLSVSYYCGIWTILSFIPFNYELIHYHKFSIIY